MKYIFAFAVAAGLLASGGAFAGPQSDLRIDGAQNGNAAVLQADYYYHHHHYHHRRYHHHHWHYY